MIPLKLTIEGLYSYQKRQTIDFTRLTSAGIFGIFGQVGSGKSSILEAISFAIYGDTERLNSKEGRGYNMMNLKSDSLYIEFIFLSGIKHKRYMATVSARRNSKRFEDVKTIERKAFADDDGSWTPVELSDLEEAIGLSYANFKRTIIIPQGRFQEFLQLDKKERTNMMKELFNLEKYDLFRKVASLDRRNSDRRQFLEGQLASIGEVSQEQLAQLKTLLDQHTNTAKELSLNLTIKRKELEEHKRLKELNGKRERLVADRTLLEAKKEEMALLEGRLREYEFCLVHFKGLMEQEQQLQQSVAATNEALASEKILLKKIQGDIATKVQQQEALSADYRQRERFSAEADDLENIAKIKTLNADIALLSESIAKGKLYMTDREAMVTLLREGLENKGAALKDLKQQLPDMAMLSKVREWFATHKSLTAQLAEAKQEHDALQAESSKLADGLRLLAEDKVLQDHVPVSSIEEAQERLMKEQERLNGAIKEKDRMLEHLMVQQKLGHYANALHAGEPCPLCGSHDHPQVLNVDDVSEKIGEVRMHRETAEASIAHCNDLDKKLMVLATKMKSASDRCAKAKLRVDKLSADVAQHHVLFIWNDYKTEDELNLAFAAAESCGKKIAEMETAIDSDNASMQKDMTLVDKSRAKIDKLTLEKASKEGQAKSLEAGLHLLQLSAFPDVVPEKLNEMAAAKRKHIKDVETRYDALTAEVATMRQQEGKYAGSIAANEATLAKDMKSHDVVSESIRMKLEESGRSSIDEVKRTLAQSLNVEVTRSQLTAFSQSLQTVAVQLLEVEKDFAGRSYSLVDHAELERIVGEMVEQEEANRKEIGRVERDIATTAAALKQHADISKELGLVVQRAAELSVLKNMLQGNRFIDFVSTAYLQNLCRAANERFYTMTRQRLSLELTADNSFQVRDYMNGGKTRSVKTLSGGQTFQASLSLALALSDNIQRMQSADQNFFFLDEGFGTLDKESLSIVFDTLKSLRKENRIVGVISHVDEMQQEIETYLQVVNHEDQGSIISTSWE